MAGQIVSPSFLAPITALVAHNGDIFYATRNEVYLVGAGDEAVLLAGNEEAGFVDKKDGKEARFNGIKVMAAWPGGGVVLADYWNHRLRLVGRDGIVSTLADVFWKLRDICVRPDGCVVVCDDCWLYVVTPDGTVAKLVDKSFKPDKNEMGATARSDNSVVVYTPTKMRQITAAGTITSFGTNNPSWRRGMVMDTAGMAVVPCGGGGMFTSVQRIDPTTNTATELVLSPDFLGYAITLDWFGNLIYTTNSGGRQQCIVRIDVGMQPGVGAGKQPAWTPTTHKLFPARARACAEDILAFSGSHVLGALWLHVLGQIPAGALGAPI
jgi:hypothetical protein